MLGVGGGESGLIIIGYKEVFGVYRIIRYIYMVYDYIFFKIYGILYLKGVKFIEGKLYIMNLI